MEFRSPVYHVIAVPIEKIIPNTYNPNTVAPPEMKLLYDSIKEDGYTMPIVCYYAKAKDAYILWTVSIDTGLCWNIKTFMTGSRECCGFCYR